MALPEMRQDGKRKSICYECGKGLSAFGCKSGAKRMDKGGEF